MTKTRIVVDTHARNLTRSFRIYDVDHVMPPFERPSDLVDAYYERKMAIAADPLLTAAGKQAALKEAKDAKDVAVTKWRASRLPAIEADLAQRRSALLTSPHKPDAARVAHMASELLKHTPEDRAVFYSSASEDERRVMEAASALVGRVPIKSREGSVWQHLLDPSMVNDAVLSRAETLHPDEAQRVRELTEVHQMTVTVAGIALSEE